MTDEQPPPVHPELEHLWRKMDRQAGHLRAWATACLLAVLVLHYLPSQLIPGPLADGMFAGFLLGGAGCAMAFHSLRMRRETTAFMWATQQRILALQTMTLDDWHEHQQLHPDCTMPPPRATYQ